MEKTNRLGKRVRECGAGELAKASQRRLNKLPVDTWKKTFQGEGKSISHTLFFQCSERKTHQTCLGNSKENKVKGGKRVVGNEIRELLLAVS